MLPVLNHNNRWCSTGNWANTHLFEILESREGRGSTMFASQSGPDQWYLRINSEPCADSILSRAVEHAGVLDIKGPNMREHAAGPKAEMEKGYWD